MAFEPTALVRMTMMMEHRDLKTGGKVTIPSAAGPVWSDSCTCWEDQNTLDPTCTGSESNSLCVALFHILLQMASLAKKAGAFQTSLILPTAVQLFPQSLPRLCSTNTPPAGPVQQAAATGERSWALLQGIKFHLQLLGILLHYWI